MNFFGLCRAARVRFSLRHSERGHCDPLTGRIDANPVFIVLDSLRQLADRSDNASIAHGASICSARNPSLEFACNNLKLIAKVFRFPET